MAGAAPSVGAGRRTAAGAVALGHALSESTPVRAQGHPTLRRTRATRPYRYPRETATMCGSPSVRGCASWIRRLLGSLGMWEYYSPDIWKRMNDGAPCHSVGGKWAAPHLHLPASGLPIDQIAVSQSGHVQLDRSAMIRSIATSISFREL